MKIELTRREGGRSERSTSIRPRIGLGQQTTKGFSGREGVAAARRARGRGVGDGGRRRQQPHRIPSRDAKKEKWQRRLHASPQHLFC